MKTIYPKKVKRYDETMTRQLVSPRSENERPKRKNQEVENPEVKIVQDHERKPRSPEAKWCKSVSENQEVQRKMTQVHDSEKPRAKK